jgi:hypothetical protein
MISLDKVGELENCALVLFCSLNDQFLMQLASFLNGLLLAMMRAGAKPSVSDKTATSVTIRVGQQYVALQLGYAESDRAETCFVGRQGSRELSAAGHLNSSNGTKRAALRMNKTA